MTKLGKRYVCGACGTVVLCLRPSEEEFACCDRPMGEMGMEELPSSD